MIAALVIFAACAAAFVRGYLSERRKIARALARSDYAETLEALARLRKRAR